MEEDELLSSSSSRSSQSSSSPSRAKVVEKGVQGVRGGPAEGGPADDQNAQAGCSSGWSLDVLQTNPEFKPNEKWSKFVN